MRIIILALVLSTGAFAAWERAPKRQVFATGYNRAMSGHAHADYVVPDPTPVLPAAYDWRKVVPLSDVKNQGQCGSCWAFGTTAALEEKLRIAGKSQDILSEQEMVSCNRSGFSCGGGDFEHGYQQSPGQSLESEFPYRAADLRCKRNLSHKWKAASWAYVGDGNSDPTVDQIKQAIMQYGVVAVTVSADDDFMNYQSGVFEGRSEDINHIVALVGWTEDGAWILRNSWGARWGEQGYMRIKFGSNSVAQQATFVQLPQ